jgi:hypothetical protein
MLEERNIYTSLLSINKEKGVEKRGLFGNALGSFPLYEKISFADAPGGVQASVDATLIAIKTANRVETRKKLVSVHFSCSPTIFSFLLL